MTRRILNIILTAILLIIVSVTGLLWNHDDTPAAGDNLTTIVIDPGHGGMDPGKVGIDNTLEKDLNLAISLEIAANLESQGFNVILTRDGDYGLYEESDTHRKSADMKNRCILIKQSSADLVISIHQNSFTDSSVHGAQVFYYESSKHSRNLANCITNALQQGIGKDNTRPAKSNSDYYMLLNTPCPSVIIECGFLSNVSDSELLQNHLYREKLTDSICLGVLDFIDNND